MNYNFDDFMKILGGESTNEEKVNVEIHDRNQTVEVYKPVITRRTMSMFEFVRVITALAKHLYSTHDISQYVEMAKDKIEINSIINPAELAFKLITEGKVNATLDRLGYEKVTFSELKINPLWINMLQSYFDKRHEIECNELLKPLGLIE